jgi:hypothetical protein
MYSIAIDLGGTIEDTWPLKSMWFAAHGFRLGPAPLSRLEVMRLIGGNEVLYLEMVNCIYSDANILTHSLSAGCAEALKTIASKCHIYLLSSRPSSQLDTTIKWLDKVEILQMIKGLALIGSDERKLSWCERNNISILVDDDIRHLQMGHADKVATRIHYDVSNRRSEPNESGVIVANTWAEIVYVVSALQSSPVMPEGGDRRAELPNVLTG